jgi:hypothetical protein
MTGSSRFHRGHGFSVTAALVAVLVAFGAPAAASAVEPTPEPAATAGPGPSPDPTTFAAPAPAPAITGPPSGTFVGSATTTISGTRSAGQEIQLLSPTGGDPLCIVAVDGTTSWSCSALALPSGPSVTLRAVVTGEPSLFGDTTLAVLAAPTVTGVAGSGLASSGIVRGTGYPGASVTATLAGGRQCTTIADGRGAWSCLFDGITSGSSRLTASQRTSFSDPSTSNASAPVTIVFDLDRPDAPTVASPSSGARVPLGGTTYTGRGEPGATVTVFAGAYSVCGADVIAGRWSCTAGGVAAGSYVVVAVQQDAAGNVGPGSRPITVAYGLPSPGAGSRATRAPAAAGPLRQDGAPGSVTPTSSQPAPPGPAVPFAPPAGHTRGGWNDPTRFATAVTPPGSAEQFPWLQSVLLALGVVLLLAVPARLLAGTISRARGGRPLWHGAAITGRNHSGEEFQTAPSVRLHRGLAGAAALVTAATLVMLSGPVLDRPAYLRLLIATILGLLVVNAVGALVPLWWSSRVLRVPASVTFLPRYLLLVGAAALASRVFGIHPALLFALLGSVQIGAGQTPARRGQLAAVRAGGLIALAVAGWLLLGALPAADGFLAALGRESANIVVLAAAGSAALVLIPLGKTSGRSILAGSPPAWAGLTVLAFTVMFAVLSPTALPWPGAGTPTLLWVATWAFAAVGVGSWAWQRFVLPSLR